MRKIYRNYLYISKNARISERVFVTRTVIAAVLVAVSTILFCSVTMAYFTDSVTSGGNKLVGGNFDVEVTVNKGNVTRNNNSSTINEKNNPQTENYTTQLSTDDEYIFTLKPKGNVTKGFCHIQVITSDDKVTNYHTNQMPPLGDKKVESYTVNLHVAANSTVKFMPIWGTNVTDVHGNDTLSALPEMTSIPLRNTAHRNTDPQGHRKGYTPDNRRSSRILQNPG